MGKKGLSYEEKRQRILEIYYSSKSVYNLKEIEKIGAKKGVVFQTIKDVNQSLVDDNLVQTDKIGAGAFFWAFPSQGYQNRQNLLENVSKSIEQAQEDIARQEAKILQDTFDRSNEDGERDELIKRYEQLKKENEELAAEKKKYARSDPELLEKFKSNSKVANEAQTRWTDNLFELVSYLKKNNPALTEEQLAEAFPILDNLDYAE